MLKKILSSIFRILVEDFEGIKHDYFIIKVSFVAFSKFQRLLNLPFLDFEKLKDFDQRGHVPLLYQPKGLNFTKFSLIYFKLY